MDFFRSRQIPYQAAALSKTNSSAKVSASNDNKKGVSMEQELSHRSIMSETYSTPIPVGFTAAGEPYFAPPVNYPPIPCGFLESGEPFYSHTCSVKPHAQGCRNTLLFK